MTPCECDIYQHSVEPCRMPAESEYTSPALCTGCLFYCYADEDDE